MGESTVAYSPRGTPPPPKDEKEEMEEDHRLEDRDRHLAHVPRTSVFGEGDDASSSILSTTSSLDVIVCPPPDHPVDNSKKLSNKWQCP